MASFTLTKGELIDLTGHVQLDSQKAELNHMGIPFKEQRDGTLRVIRAVAEGRADPDDRVREEKPNLSVI